MLLLSPLPLITWARAQGAHFSESIDIRTTEYGGRGLFAITDIPANAKLITLPGHLQLGVGQLAEGDDAEMQTFSRELPWRDVLEQGLNFLPCGIALLSERRKGAASIFAPYLSELPVDYTNAVAFGGGFDGDISTSSDVNDLESWTPAMAHKVTQRRTGLTTLHNQLAPPSVPLRDLCWASAVVCSRSLVRHRVPDLTAAQVQTIGDFCASDHSRLLPLIDLVNHGGLSGTNADVRHREEEDDTPPNDPFSTSLISMRAIAAGEEVLLDYGGSQPISNERLLLDYGFVLPMEGDSVALRLEDLLTAVNTLDADRAGMRDVSPQDVKELESLIVSLVNYFTPPSQPGASPLLFDALGRPTLSTLCVALALTCRGPDDVERILTPYATLQTESTPISGAMIQQLLADLVESSTDAHAAFALGVLKKAIAMALAQRTRELPTTADDDGGGGVSFATVAREYSESRREMLQRAAQ